MRTQTCFISVLSLHEIFFFPSKVLKKFQNQKKSSEILKFFEFFEFLKRIIFSFSLSTSYISYLLPLYILSSYHFKIIQFGINWLFKSTIVHFDCIYLLLSKSRVIRSVPEQKFKFKSHIHKHNNNQPTKADILKILCVDIQTIKIVDFFKKFK